MCFAEGVLELNDARYPALLKQIPKPPSKIFYKGNCRAGLFDKCLSVVGSRKMTVYGREVVRWLLKTLVHKQITVVSGFTQGVDACVHKTCLELGISTIGVFPCGVNVLPNAWLHTEYDQIVYSKGLILSEFEHDFEPKRWTFAKRNRIIAGLCKALVVVEAAENSGSLIAANYANTFGRKVFAVPGSVFSSVSTGCNRLLVDYAHTLYSNSEINEFFGIDFLGTMHVDGFSSNAKLNTEKIVALLTATSMTIDDISKELNSDVSEIARCLTLLAVQGLIKEEGGCYYACKT